MTHQPTQTKIDHLTIDIDIPFDVAVEILDFITEHIRYWTRITGYKVKRWAIFPSQSFNTHISIVLDKPIDMNSKIHAEVCLGSDLMRAWYTWARHKLWKVKSDFLFREKITENKERNANIEQLITTPVTIQIPLNVYKELRRLELKKLKTTEQMILEAIYLYLASQR